MAKFKAGDMITGQLRMSDGTEELRVFMVNRVIDADYSLDNGNGFIDSRARVSEIDEAFEVCK